MNKHIIAQAQELDDVDKSWGKSSQKNEAVHKCYEWFESDRQAKSPYNAEMDEMYKLYTGNHWRLLGEDGRGLRTEEGMSNHPNAVENITFAMIEGLVAEFSSGRELVDYPTEPGDEEIALKMTQLKEHIGYKNRIDTEFIKFVRNLFLYGTGVWEKNWDPSWKGGKGPNRWEGDIRWISCHPRTVFPDARCLESSEDGRRIHKATYWTIEDVKETWPDAEGLLPDSMSDDIIVGAELEESSGNMLDEQVLVVDTWYKGSPLFLDEGEEDLGPGLHLLQWAGDGSLQYLAHSNYVYFDPGEDITFPIQLYKCYERDRSPWGIGEAYMIKNPQIVINKTAELILESHMHDSMGQTWYQQGALSKQQKDLIKKKGTLPGMWIEVLDLNSIHRVSGRSAAPSLTNEPIRLQKVAETIIGRFDISQGKTSGSVTAFRALDLLAQRAQVRLNTKDMIIRSSMEDSGNYINRLINRYYTSKRKYRILGKEDASDEFGTYNPNEVKKAYMYDTDETIPLLELEAVTAGQEELPEAEQLLEGRDYEVYSPEFDTKCKTSNKLATDRLFYMEMAKELLNSQLIDEETFFYVLEYGKFPPYEKIIRDIEERREQAALAQQQEQMLQQGMMEQPQQQMTNEQEQEIMQFIQYLQAEAPEVLQEIGKHPEEEQLIILMEMMQKMSQEPAPEAEEDYEEGLVTDSPTFRQQLIQSLQNQ